MIIPNWLFIAVVLILSLISAGFLVWIILKTIPRGNSSTAHSVRGCAGLFLFMFLTLACVASLTCAVPKATVVMAGPDKDHSTKAIIFSVPESFKKKYGIADFTMGRSYVVNTTDRNDWQQALQALIDQRPLVKSYVMDEIYNMMESGEAAVAAYYAGDYFTMCDAQADSVDLQFYYPENTNYFIDAMCIPTSCRDQELAECFINFMLSREAAVANAEYIYYASPNRLVYDDPEYIDDMGEDTMAILYPDIGSFRDAYNRSAYRNLDQDTLTYVNSLWETLKIN